MSASPADLFDLAAFTHRDVFLDCEYAWDVLKKIGPYVLAHAKPFKGGGVEVEDGAHIIGDVWLGAGTKVEAGAYIRGPVIIGERCSVRANSYIRGDALVGDDCVVGNATELKNTLLLNGAAAPHYNYCGDSVLGNNVNLGAGTKLSNYKIGDDKTIRIRIGDLRVDTGLTKFGAVIGDNAATGCNSVLNPGTVLGRGVLVYPCMSVAGYVPPSTIVKTRTPNVLLPARR